MKILKLLFAFLIMGAMAYAQQISLVQYASGFSSPTDIVHAGDDRLFIVEQRGTVKIIDGSGTTLSTSFLDINSLVTNSLDERGLLGLAFHPDYANNGYFFVHYSQNNGDSRISRFSVDSNDPNIADSGSEFVIMDIDQPYWNHNAGDLAFGPDGYLYIGTGDGGSAGDPQNRAQNTQSLLGKMLRIDINNGNPYSIPADNPFLNDNDVLDEIWAIGLRNPWRYSFDRESGDLWIGDVGQGEWEEITFELANSGGGFNYGWRCYEGDATYNPSGCGSAADYSGPLLDYSQGNTHCSVTGGFVYRGCDNPDLVGHYIYADYCSGRFWSIVPDGNGGWNDQEVGNFPGYDISTFGEDASGELYAARLTQGRIYKVNSTNSISIDITQAGNVLTGPTGYDTYQWYLNGVLIDGATTSTYEILENGDYTLEVASTEGCSYSSMIFAGVLGINDIAAFDAFSINPNPFSDVLNLTMEVNTSVEIQIEVLDVAGKVLYAANQQTLIGTSTEVIKLGDVPAGVYFIHLKTEEGTIVEKVVKE